LLPRIGYGSARKTRHRLPSGYYKFRVFNTGDLSLLMMQSRKFAAEIGRTVSAQNRKKIIERASQLGIHLVRGYAKRRIQEKHKIDKTVQ
jgi:large subunit ribosomal protein L32e